MNTSFDQHSFRQTAGQFATGVTVIAMEVGGAIRAITANSFTSVSLDPPLVLFCLGKGTRAGAQIQDVPGFAVSILREDQQDLSAFFAGIWKGSPPAYTFHAWDGGPRLDGCVAIGCTMHAIHDGGDHWIVVGQVVALYRPERPGRPLLFFGGRYAAIEAGGPAAGELPFVIAWSGPTA